MDTGKSGLSRDDIILMAAEAKMAPSDLVPSNYEGILDSLTKFAEQVCKWQRERDCHIIDTIDDGEAPEYRACQEAIMAWARNG